MAFVNCTILLTLSTTKLCRIACRSVRFSLGNMCLNSMRAYPLSDSFVNETSVCCAKHASNNIFTVKVERCGRVKQAYSTAKRITMVLTLYKLNASPPARSVLMTIEALNIPDVEYVDVNLLNADHLTEEFKKINPQHTIPVLKDDDFHIWDSHAIATYLVTKYGENDSLYPTDPKKRAVIDQRLHFDSGILFPALRGTAEPILFWGEKSPRHENLLKIKTAYEFAEKFITAPWLAGDELSLADICCVTTISSMDKIMPIDANLYPNLTAWLERCSQLEIYKKANEPGLADFGTLLKSKLG